MALMKARPLRLAPLAAACGAALALAALAGCMTVRIESREADVRVLRHLGWLSIEVPTPDKAVIGSVSGVGLAATPMGWSAGYTRQRWAALGPQCRAVLWIDHGALDAATRQALSAAAGVCVAEERLAAGTTSTASNDDAFLSKKEPTP